jgi:hypothetical protein
MGGRKKDKRRKGESDGATTKKRRSLSGIALEYFPVSAIPRSKENFEKHLSKRLHEAGKRGKNTIP